MTEFSSFIRTGAVAGLLLVSTAILAQQPGSMPAPRYQSPGVAPVQSPVPQLRLPVTPSIGPNATVVEDVVVRVNDQIISRADVERAQQRLQAELAQDPAASADAAEREKNLLRDLIDQQLLLSKGKENGVNASADAEVIRRLDEIRKQNNLPTMEALEAAAAQQGVSFEDFKANIKNQIITQNVVREEVGRSIRLTHADEQRFYDAHKEEFTQPEQVRLSEILVPAPADASEDVLAQAQKKADEIHAKLVAGADFAATAKASSGGPTAAQGGDLGIFKHGTLAPVLEEKTFALPQGGFTDPVRTRQGFVILKAVEHISAGTPPLDKIEPEVQNAMYQEQIQPALRAYLTRLREESYVDLKPGFVDSGASPKQTKPVFSTYVAPAPKKKSASAKQRLDRAKSRVTNAKASLAAASSATPAVAVLDKHGRPRKVKKEKVRFGQAPRTALPGALDDADGTTEASTAKAPAPGSTASSNGAASGNGAASSGSGAAPGTALAPVDSNNTVAANAAPDDVDPLAPKAGPREKTRFSSRAIEVKQKNNAKVVAKAADKAAATPKGPGADEKRATAVQSSALGLNGNTGKPKKVKRKKGDPKERLQAKPEEAKAALQDNGLPDRLHQVNKPGQSASSASGNPAPDNSKEQQKQSSGQQPTPQKPISDGTSLAPVEQPAPGNTTPGEAPAAAGSAPGSTTPPPR